MGRFRWLIPQNRLDRRASKATGFRWLLATLGCAFASGVVVIFTHGDETTSSVDKTITDQRFRPKKQAFFPAPVRPGVDESTIGTTHSPSGNPSTIDTQPSPSTPEEEIGDTTPSAAAPVPRTQPDRGAPIKPGSDANRSDDSPSASANQPGSRTPNDASTASSNPRGAAQPNSTTDGSGKESSADEPNAHDPNAGNPNAGNPSAGSPSADSSSADSNRPGSGTDGPGAGESANQQNPGGPSLAPSATTEPTRFDTCADAYDAGVAPILAGEPGYERRLDADADGIACDIDLRI